MPTASPPASVNERSSQDVDPEKDTVVYQEMVAASVVSDNDAQFLVNFTEEQHKRVIRKVDYRLVPVLLVLYLISFIDRANIGSHCHVQPCRETY